MNKFACVFNTLIKGSVNFDSRKVKNCMLHTSTIKLIYKLCGSDVCLEPQTPLPLPERYPNLIQTFVLLSLLCVSAFVRFRHTKWSCHSPLLQNVYELYPSGCLSCHGSWCFSSKEPKNRRTRRG